MRMWMISPELMCDKHLLGEHVELHMIAGANNKLKKMDGFVDSNCLEWRSVEKRHGQLVKEMQARHFMHNSIMAVMLRNESSKVVNSRVDVEASFQELMDRCDKCRRRFENVLDKHNGNAKGMD